MQEIICEQCQKVFKDYISNHKLHKFCSKQCYWESKRGKSNHRKGIKLTSEHIKKLSDAHKGQCAWNKGLKGSTPGWQKGKKRPYMAGENNPRWIKDRSKLIKRQKRNDSAYKDWRKNVWMRDGFKCQINDKNCEGKIVAHHILTWKDYPQLRYKITNGITLCRAHHPRRRAEEKRLAPVYQVLVTVSN